MSEYHKNKKRIEFQVGLFIIITLAVLISGYGWLRNSFSLKHKIEVQVTFQNAKSILEGDIVTCFGVSCGKVKSIKITKDGALMILLLDKMQLTDNASFIIQEIDLMGNKQIDINPGNSEIMLDFRKLHKGDVQQGITSAIAKGYETINKINNILDKLEENEGIVTNSKKMISETIGLITEVKNQLPKLFLDLSESVDKVNNITNSIDKSIKRNEKEVDDIINNLPQTVQNLNTALTQINKISTNLATISDSFLTTDNSIKLLLQDKELYNQIKNTAVSADSLLKDIKQNPKKYLELKVF